MTVVHETVASTKHVWATSSPVEEVAPRIKAQHMKRVYAERQDRLGMLRAAVNPGSVFTLPYFLRTFQNVLPEEAIELLEQANEIIHKEIVEMEGTIRA